MNVPDDLKYTKTHEWVKIEGDIATIGISDHAQDQLGDVVFVEIPMNTEVQKGSIEGAIESAKAIGELNIPVSGEIIEMNEELESNPEKINESPYEEGWILKIKMSNPSEADSLLSAEQYKATLE